MKTSPFPIGPNIVEDILHFSTINIKANHHNRCYSTPGHLIHLLREGNYKLSIGGRTYEAKKGDLIYYFETEEVLWHHNPVKVSFYTLAFQAPRLSPLPEDQRVFKSNSKIRNTYEKMNQLISHDITDSFSSAFYSYTNTIVSEIINLKKSKPAQSKETNAWVKVESLIRTEKLYKCDLNSLSNKVNVSSATLSRACHNAFTISPMKRLREIRMECAKGLLKYSPMNISQIAYELGYSRVHEFSREFGKIQELSPSDYRNSHHHK